MTSSAGLTVAGVSKRYGRLVALDDLSLEVRRGEMFGFVGSNGAGKTTTMRIVLGVLAADSGQVLLGDRPVDLDVRRRIGYMPAERGLYPKMKVGAQLRYLARLHGLSAGDAAESVTRWTTRLGVDGRLDDTVEALSTGNQQRVQLAAALVHDPDLLVLDEPFSGLDPVAVDVMSEVLRERAAAGSPVMFSSHQLELVEQLCDRVGIIAEGAMRAQGSVEELRAAGGLEYVVRVRGAAQGWAGTVPGVATATEDPDGRTIVRLDENGDPQSLLAAAMATGPVEEFTPRRASLSQLFREVVSS